VAAQIKIRYSYRLEDLEDVYDAADRISPGVRRTRREAIVAGYLFLVAPFLAASSFLHPEAFLLIIAPCGVGLIWWGMQSPKRDARRRYSQAVSIWPEIEATLAESGIMIETPATSGELAWSAVSQAVEGKTALGLVSKNQMHIFPRRAFSAEQWDEFLKLARERVHPSDE
jgi:hypothetical protein